MSRLDAIRTTLTNRVFNADLGTDVTITPKSISSSSDGGFTPGTESSGTATTVKGIPFSNSTMQYFKEMFGDSKLGEGTCILPYTTSVRVKDTATWLGKIYYVYAIESFPIGGGTAALLIKCNERS